MQISYSADEIRALVQPKKEQGQTAATIRGIASLDAAQPGDLSFLGNAKYKAQVAATRASLVLLPMDFVGTPTEGQIFFWVDNPSAALARLCKAIEQALWPKPQPGVHPSAQIAPGAQVAASATVGPLCVVEEGAEIGEAGGADFDGRRGAGGLVRTAGADGAGGGALDAAVAVGRGPARRRAV